jgi:hypothetical protein
MDTLDLNIDNYHLDDILNLFNIHLPFEEEDLKVAKKKSTQNSSRQVRIKTRSIFILLQSI